MKKLKLLLFSVSPLGIGYILNYIMLKLNWHGTFILIISILFFIYWFFVGKISINYSKSILESILFGNSFAFISIILIVVQEIVMGRYLFNIIGILPQLFYLSTLSVAFKLENILQPFISIHSMWMTYIVSFILMIAVYYVGCKMRFKSSK